MKQYLNTNIGTLVIFTLLMLSWGISWPVSKIGLQSMHPLWFSASRLAVGTFTIFCLLVVTRRLYLPKKQDLPLILSIGLFQIAGFLILINFGMTYVAAGRAAIIAYTTPLWATPIAIIFFKEKLTWLKALGLLLGLVGIFVLFSPWTFNWSNQRLMIGNCFLLLAALSWTIAIIHTRYAVWHTPVFSLIFWQLLLGTCLVLILCLIIQPNTDIIWQPSLIFAILYTGILATAFGFWGAIEVSRRLPVITTSLSFLSVPVVGLISSAILLGETITFDLSMAMMFILLGLACVALADWRIKKFS